MKAEIIFPDMINLYGEQGNARLLRQILNDDCRFTLFTERPWFADEDVDLIYIGPTSEPKQITILDQLRPYRSRLQELIEQGCTVLCVGNGGDYFGTHIAGIAPNPVERLGIFSYHTLVDYQHRHNSFYLGTDANHLEFVGFKSQFGLVHDIPESQTWLHTLRGFGNTAEMAGEGFRHLNFYLTNLIGPFLVMNPHFTAQILREHDVEMDRNLFDQMVKAYDQRVLEFKDPKTVNL